MYTKDARYIALPMRVCSRCMRSNAEKGRRVKLGCFRLAYVGPTTNASHRHFLACITVSRFADAPSHATNSNRVRALHKTYLSEPLHHRLSMVSQSVSLIGAFRVASQAKAVHQNKTRYELQSSKDSAIATKRQTALEEETLRRFI